MNFNIKNPQMPHLVNLVSSAGNGVGQPLMANVVPVFLFRMKVR